MSRFGRFVILALIGFALGAGLAYFQHSRDTASTSDIVAGAPEMPASPESTVDSTTAMTSDAAVAGSSIGGAFSLTDHNGNPVTDASFPGKLKLVFFGFANCPDICPATLDKLSTALNMLGVQSGQLQPMFITTDPARDTPEALKTYLQSYPAFVGLTGTEEQIKAAEDAYKVYSAASTDGSGSIDHSAYVYLMTEDNKLLETFGKDDTADAISEKIKTHLSAGTPAGEVAPIAAAPSTEGAVIDETTPPSDTGAADAVTTDSVTTDTATPSSDTPAADVAPTDDATPDSPAGGLDAPSTSPSDPVNTP